MRDKSKSSRADRTGADARSGADRGLAAASAVAGSHGGSEPDVVDFQPLPVYPLLGVQVHCVRWQKIVQGMKRKGVVVRVHRESDRGGLFKAASRLAVKLTSRRCAGTDGRSASWLVRVVDARGGHPADIDAADPTASERGRYRALSLLVLQRGALALQGREMAVALHRSLREYLREHGLAGRRQRNAVVVSPDGAAGYTVSIHPSVRAAYAARDQQPAA
jgi:hypothetical protein